MNDVTELIEPQEVHVFALILCQVEAISYRVSEFVEKPIILDVSTVVGETIPVNLGDVVTAVPIEVVIDLLRVGG